MRTFSVLNGPNLNRLGRREPEIYGTATLADLAKLLRAEARRLRVKVVFFQSNHEGALIDRIHADADRGVAGFIVNFGAYTHTSIALLDALKSVAPLPAVEVHLSDLRKREPFRHHSYVQAACVAQICGKGFAGYVEALGLLAARTAPAAR
jgi:3-dehydroquinate dehydratase-2